MIKCYKSWECKNNYTYTHIHELLKNGEKWKVAGGTIDVLAHLL